MRGIKTAAIAAVAAAGVVALPAHGQSDPSPRTMTFTSVQNPRDMAQIDVKPKGDSIGDAFIFASTLKDSAGKPTGRVVANCVAADRAYEGLACSLDVLLPDGRIELQGVGENKKVPGVGRAPEEYVVTGGTGAYAGATGTLTRSGNGKNDQLTFTLAG